MSEAWQSGVRQLPERFAGEEQLGEGMATDRPASQLGKQPFGRKLLPQFGSEGLDSYLATAQAALPLRCLGEAFAEYLSHRGRGVPAKGDYDKQTLESKARVGRLLNCHPSQIALLPSVSQGLDLISRSISFRRGDNVVIDELDYPSLCFPWLQLEREGVEIRIVQTSRQSQDVRSICNAADARTRVVCVSHVSFLTGYRYDLNELSNGLMPDCKLVVDVSQSLGVVPVEMDTIDFAIGSCHKWLLGPHGLAVLAWNKSRSPEAEPRVASQHSVSNFDFPLTGKFTLKPDARRFELGTEAYPAHYQLNRALAFLEQFPSVAIEQHVERLTDQLVEELAKIGLHVVTPNSWAQRGGNICFLADDAERLQRALASHGIQVIGEKGRVRISPHIFNEAGDVDRLVTALRNVD
jgi:cysteine desulfurase / selenocysteine lyase